MKRFLLIPMLILLISTLSLTAAGSETSYTKVLDVDLSVVKNKVFSSEDMVPFFKLPETSSGDYIFTSNGLWLKQNADVIVPVILTGDFEIEITIFTVGITPESSPLQAIKDKFPVSTNKPAPEYFNIELWPYTTGTSETLRSKIDKIGQLSDPNAGGVSQTNFGSDYDLPYRITFAQDASTLSFGGIGRAGKVTGDYYRKPFPKQVTLKELGKDGQRNIIIKKEGEYIIFVIEGIPYDLTGLVKGIDFNKKAPVILYFRGSKQQGLIPSITEAVYLKSIKIAAPEETFFNIKDVIEAQKN